MKILLRESKDFSNFKSGKYLRGGKWLPAVAYNVDEGWAVVRITAEEYARELGLKSVEDLASEYGYDDGVPKYIYLGYDLELSQNDDGEGESAVIGVKWNDGSYAHYGLRADDDHTTFGAMIGAIVTSGLLKQVGKSTIK